MWTSVLLPYHPWTRLTSAGSELTWIVCLNRPDYDGLDYEAEYATDEYNHATALGVEDRVFDYPFLALKKLLGDGSFYYSRDFNLTDRLQDRWANSNSRSPGLADALSVLRSRQPLTLERSMKICYGIHTWSVLCSFSEATSHRPKGRVLTPPRSLPVSYEGSLTHWQFLPPFLSCPQLKPIYRPL